MRRARWKLADALRRVVDWLDPETAADRVEAFAALDRLGRYAYGPTEDRAVPRWTSPRVMINAALRRAGRDSFIGDLK